jgi:hypothetical protein
MLPVPNRVAANFSVTFFKPGLPMDGAEGLTAGDKILPAVYCAWETLLSCCRRWEFGYAFKVGLN